MFTDAHIETMRDKQAYYDSLDLTALTRLVTFCSLILRTYHCCSGRELKPKPAACRSKSNTPLSRTEIVHYRDAERRTAVTY